MEYITKDRKILFITYLENQEEVTIFNHFKNKKYIILTIGKNTETMDDEVVYKALYGDNKI